MGACVGKIWPEEWRWSRVHLGPAVRLLPFGGVPPLRIPCAAFETRQPRQKSRITIGGLPVRGPGCSLIDQRRALSPCWRRVRLSQVCFKNGSPMTSHRVAIFDDFCRRARLPRNRVAKASADGRLHRCGRLVVATLVLAPLLALPCYGNASKEAREGLESAEVEALAGVRTVTGRVLKRARVLAHHPTHGFALYERVARSRPALGAGTIGIGIGGERSAPMRF